MRESRNNKRSKSSKISSKKSKKRKNGAKKRQSDKPNSAALFIAAGILAVCALVGTIAGNQPKDQKDAAFLQQIEKGESEDARIELTANIDDKEVKIDLHDYLIGVVSCEMPASYEVEALKAQAMAARTYTEYKMRYQPCKKSENALVCDDPAHCQAYADEDFLREKWGKKYDEYRKKIEKAVSETDGLVITYDGKLIEAVYSASCGGMTENSENVFGNALPYLKSVESGDGDEKDKVITLTTSEYVDLLKKAYADLHITPETASEKTGKPVRYESGRVEYVKIANAKISGGTMRKIFSLPSTMFSIKFHSGKVEFDCKGYGHGVGMSQVGANAYAKKGMDAKAIIAHFYSGVEIEKIKNLKKFF